MYKIKWRREGKKGKGRERRREGWWKGRGMDGERKLLVIERA